MQLACMYLPRDSIRETEDLRDILGDLITEDLAGEASIIHIADQIHLYLVHETRLPVKRIHRQISDTAGTPHTEFDRSAVRRFLLDYLGSGGKDVGTTRARNRAEESFTRCTDATLTGSTLHGLHQRALSFSNEIRDKYPLEEHPVLREDLTRELAGKILENLASLTLSICGAGEDFREFLFYWDRQNPNRLYVMHDTFETAESMALTSDAIPVRWEDRRNALEKSDLIILLSEQIEPVVTESLVKRNLQQRKRRHLVIFNWGEETAAEQSITRYNPVFLYSNQELKSLLETNRTAREKILEKAESGINTVVNDFFTWLYSDSRYRFQEMVGRSRQMQQVFELIRRVAQTDISVLIQGETGTGKELAARAIHHLSQRSASGKFTAVNCGAIPETLLESELFGHTQGAFTGAHEDRTGLLLEASGGTVLLDEIGDTSQAFQIKLLRALQEREITPLGSNKPLPIDVRIIAATSRDLEQELDRENFRPDLYYRVNVVKIIIPPLRDRPDDIIPLIRHFMDQFNRTMGKQVQKIAPEVRQTLLSYHWPGNVRELENVVERAIALTLGDEITLDDLPENVIQQEKEETESTDADSVKTLEELEKEHISNLLDRFQGNLADIAEKLGIGRTTLWRKIKKYDLEQ